MMRSLQHVPRGFPLVFLVTLLAGKVVFSVSGSPLEKFNGSVTGADTLTTAKLTDPKTPTEVPAVKLELLNENKKEQNAAVDKTQEKISEKLTEVSQSEKKDEVAGSSAMATANQEDQVATEMKMTEEKQEMKKTESGTKDKKNDDGDMEMSSSNAPVKDQSMAEEKPETLNKMEQTSEMSEKPKVDGTTMESTTAASGKPSNSEMEKKPEEPQKVMYNGYKVVRVVAQNKQQKKVLKQLETNGDVSTWLGNGTAIDILVRENSVFDFLKEKKLSYDVVIEDLQRAIDEENPQVEQDEWSDLEGRNGHRMTWQMYHRMADIHGYLDYLTNTYPDLCSLETIGYSVQGKPLKVLKVSSGKNNSHAIWVDSGIHAREWISPATCTYVINQIVENGDGTHGVDWYFLPLVNPDGYEHSHTTDRLWRKNRSNEHKGQCAGTDLNRNFGYRWGGQGASQQPCRETYAGSGPFSEPETSAIKTFVLNNAERFKAFISLHSYGQYILYPWGYDRKVPPDYSDLHRVGRAMAQAMKNSGGQNYKVGAAAATLYPAAGGSDDWAKGSARIKYSYTIELRDTGRHGFILPAQYIKPTAQETYAALKVLAKEVTQL